MRAVCRPPGVYRVMPDRYSQFTALIDAATPAPWVVVADSAGLHRVESGDHVVERALREPFAHYMAALRNAAARSYPAKDLATIMRAVGAQWVFVAPTLDGASWYMHDSVTKVGAGTLSEADARFLDAAKHVLAPASQDGRMPEGRRLMIPRRTPTPDATEEYLAFATETQPRHALSGRNDLDERTAAINRGILRHMDFDVPHRVLDVGCGDASLLAALAPHVAEGIGTLLTDAERRKLAATPQAPNLSFVTASLDNLSQLDGPFDRVIVNGSIHFARRRARAARVLRALAALMPLGGKLWVGELHAKECRERVFVSKLEALRHVKARHGPAFALAFARYLWRRRHRADLIVEPAPGDWWHVKPNDFAALADRCGFEVEGTWTCLDMTGDTFYALQDRYSCRLRKR